MRSAILVSFIFGLLLPGPARSQQDSAPTQPATRIAPSAQQRIADLVAVVEGQNSPEARRIAARELLLQSSAEAGPRLAAILSGTNTAAKTAVAAALADLPAGVEPSPIEPLLAMLLDADIEARNAASAALAAYRGEAVLARLAQIAADRERPSAARLAAINTLALIATPEAIDVLAERLRDSSKLISQAALTAFEDATAVEFRGNVDEANAWYGERRALPREQRQAQQIERLLRRDRNNDRRLQTLEQRLSKTLRETYLRAPESERQALQLGFLTDSAEVVRRLGLELVRAQVEEGKPPAPEVINAARALLGDSDTLTCAAAIRTVATFRDPADSDRLQQILAQSAVREVRQAAASALGYVGDAGVLPALEAVLTARDDGCLREAVASIGRLAERKLLNPAQVATLTDLLLTTFAQTDGSDPGLRERILRALGILGDPRARGIVLAALGPTEPPIVRQSAAQSAANLGGAELADALVLALADSDPGVRRTAADSLAMLATTESQFAALAGRLLPSHEPDEGVRAAVWRGLLQAAGRNPGDRDDRWLKRLPDGLPDQPAREIELMQTIEAALAGSSKPDLERLASLRVGLAAALANAGLASESINAYRRALSDLASLRSADIPKVRAALLRLALQKDGYNAEIAAALRVGDPPPDLIELWQIAKSEVERRLTSQNSEQAIALLDALERFPIVSWPEEVIAEIGELRHRAEALRAVGAAPKTPDPVQVESLPEQRFSDE